MEQQWSMQALLSATKYLEDVWEVDAQFFENILFAIYIVYARYVGYTACDSYEISESFVLVIS